MLAQHQIDAVARASGILESRGGVILADGVGLGKSFVAAELMRSSGCGIDLIVPAALIEQWRETLSRFGLEATLLTHDGIAAAPFVAQPVRRFVVVDEAHSFRNPRTRRYAALARRTIAAEVVLITATPVCNSAADLAALLALIARDDLLADVGIPSIDVAFERNDRASIARIIAELVIRRDRSVLPHDLQFGELEREVVRHTPPPVPEIDELEFPLIGEYHILRTFLRRRLESSEAALAESARRQLQFYRRAIAALAAGRTLPKRDYRRAFGHEEDRDAFQDVLFWDLFAPPGDADPLALQREIVKLQSILTRVVNAPSTKRRTLVELLARIDEPVLIFTGAAATARDLAQTLGCGLVTSRSRSRDDVLRLFRQGALDVVVSTDLAAEGLNLQRAGVVVHYDLPWNPVKLDQRNGRAYRIGQQRPAVRAIYFVPTGRETGIVETIARKNRTRRRILAGGEQHQTRGVPTLRPRLAGAAFLRLQPRGVPLPAVLARRHKAGIERLINEMAGEYLDDIRVAELVTLAEADVRVVAPRRL